MMQDSELLGLIAAWLDGRLDDEGSRVLQQQLQESSQARSVFRQYAQLDAALYEAADISMSEPAKLISGALEQRVHNKPSEAASIPTTPSSSEQSPVPATRSDGQITFGKVAAWGTAWCAAVALGVAFVLYFDLGNRQADSVTNVQAQSNSEHGSEASANKEASLKKPPAPVATLSSAEGAVWQDSQLQIGQQLHEGESFSLTRGEARISVGFGAEIVAHAPCALTFLSSKRIHLHQGEVGVDVATWAKGFTVVTDEMEIVDLGTTFTVTVSPGVKSETTVLKGVVRVHPSKVQNERRRGLLVTEGQQVSVDESGLRKYAKPTQSREQLNRLDFGSAEPYRPVLLNNTGFGLSEGDEDQHWRIVAGPENEFAGPQFATVCIAHERYLENDPEASQWISITDWETASPNSTYTFQTEFSLDDYDLSTMQLFGRFLADNGIAAVRVNGQPVQVQSWVDNVTFQSFGHSQFRFVNITDGLVTGRNTIEIDVRNGEMVQGKPGSLKHRAIPNPMALRVEWYAFGRIHQPAPNDEAQSY